ncbi:MAG: hypothetical protein K2X66_17695, partial [Cyanobacteria bacterium]|nr:hypothetical protein [Cyanobacteriota bacterium]
MFQPILKLSESEMERIHRVAPILKKIEGSTQVPWQLLAGIWYRESFSVTPPVTPGGPWQFDPPPAPAVVRRYL